MSTPHSPPARSGPSLLSLPLELRHSIYDFLLDPLKEEPKYADIYLLPHEHPVRDFSEYRSLQYICNQLHDEVAYHFETLYAPHLTVHFVDNVPALYDFSQRLAHARPNVRSRIRFNLTSRCELAAIGSRIQPATKTFINHHLAGFDSRASNKLDWVKSAGEEKWWSRADGTRCKTFFREHALVNAVYPPTRPGGDGIQTVQRWLKGMSDSAYEEGRGRVCELSWEGYEVEGAEDEWRDVAAGGYEGLSEGDLEDYVLGMARLVGALVGGQDSDD